MNAALKYLRYITALEGEMKYILIATILFNGVTFGFLGVHLNMERLMTFLLLLPMTAVGINSAIRNAVNSDGSFEGGWLFAAWALSLFVSLCLSTNPLAHINGYIISIIPVVLYFFFASGRKTSTVLHRSLEPALWYLSGFGVLAYAAWMGLHASWLSFCIDRMNRVQLTTIEPNIYGTTVSYLFLLHFPYFKNTLRHRLLYVLCIAAVILSFSKAPYVALAIGATTYLFLSGRLKSSRFQMILFASLFTLLILGALFATVLTEVYAHDLDRANSLPVRLFVLGFAIDHFLAHPIFGNGPLDFGLYGRQLGTLIGDPTGRGIWIANMVIAIAYDSGIVGFIIYATFVVRLMHHGYRMAKREGSKVHMAYLSGLLALLITSQATTVHLTALFGIAAGLLGTGLPRKAEAAARSYRVLPDVTAGAAEALPQFSATGSQQL